jgi:AhpD family alkylhydroperoxidase
MQNRINFGQLEPNAYKALMGLENYLLTTGLNPTHKNLIKIRASQINGCAFCIDMHTKDAKKHGETEQRIYVLSAWKEIDHLYTLEERAILALTEEMTLIPNGGVSDETYQKIADLFDGNYIAQLMTAIIAINAWNRMAITTRLQPAG